MDSHLFSPLTVGQQTLANRIVVSPMCQYSANDGCATMWHSKHLGTFSGSGAGLVMVEATAVERAGRITHGCLGLYSDANEFALARTLAFCRASGMSKFGIQIGHAGRKGSCTPPWEGGGPLTAGQDPWRTYAASNDDRDSVIACQQSDLDRIRQAFQDAAVRAVRLGFEFIEVHAAHGYLLHQFLSSLTNQRNDQYGQSLENRLRFPLEVFEAVRQVVPVDVALGVRLTGSDWLEHGITIDEAIAFSRALEALGCNYVDITSGGLMPAKIPVGPGYQLDFARAVKKMVGIPVQAVGMIVTAEQAEEVIATESADLVAMARAFLDNPHWPYEAARKLGADLSYPRQYARAESKSWPGSALKDGL